MEGKKSRQQVKADPRRKNTIIKHTSSKSPTAMPTGPSAVAARVCTSSNSAALDVVRVIGTAVVHISPAISPAGGCRNADSIVSRRIAGAATRTIHRC